MQQQINRRHQQEDISIYMDLNREAAMQLWVRDYDKDQEAFDFSGRLMKKCAYGQSGSDFGWNIDHILPKSQGGKNNKDNLICTHIQTNVEKADGFPCFKANGKAFQIITKNGKWVIEELPKTNNAKSTATKQWNRLFGNDVNETTDFAGRVIRKIAFGKSDKEGGWSLDKYVKEKDSSDRNIFIANVLTIEERQGKPNFYSNNSNWSLRNTDLGYTFKNKDIIVEDDLFNPTNVIEIIDRAINDESIEWINYIVIKYTPSYGSLEIEYFINTITKIAEIFSEPVSYESHIDKNIFVIKYLTDTKEKTQNVANAAMLIKTYIPLLKAKFGLTGINIFNFMENIKSTIAALSINDIAKYNQAVGIHLRYIDNYRFYGGYGGSKLDSLYVNALVAENIKERIDGFTNETFSTDWFENTYHYVETSKKIENLLKN